MSTSKCWCGARWRTNYSHGRKGKGVTVMIVEHDKDCSRGKKKRGRKRN